MVYLKIVKQWKNIIEKYNTKYIIFYKTTQMLFVDNTIISIILKLNIIVVFSKAYIHTTLNVFKQILGPILIQIMNTILEIGGMPYFE